MLGHFLRYPLFALILMISGLSMVVPGLYAAKIGNYPVMQVFFASAILTIVLGMIIGISLMNRRPKISARSHLTTVLLSYTVLPAFLAYPFMELVPAADFVRAYFEMLSSLTTTGATLINDPASIAAPLHLWRATVGWMGGLMILIIAFSIMEPMNLGGFEIRSLVSGTGIGAASYSAADPSERIIRNLMTLGPIYVLVTFILAMLLISTGERSFVASVHAMSVISTSGISATGGLENASSGRLGEMIICLFFVFALSHRAFLTLTGDLRTGWIKRDVELRLAGLFLIVVPALLFVRHWTASLEFGDSETMSIVGAIWGSFFTTFSFLTTTGFVSADWNAAQIWSGLETPGIILLALAVTGGGIATTAGGVKLLRIYALYRHGLREMERLVHPSSVGGAGMAARRFRREGAYIAWMFLMLFLIGMGVIMIALTALGTSFEHSIAFAVAAVTNTGPAAHMFDPLIFFSELNDLSLLIVSVAMIFGRVEVLLLIAVLNPAYWRG